MRTRVDIDDPILKEVKSLGKKEGKSLGRIVSDLLARSLRTRRTAGKERKARRWITRPMASRVDLADKEAVCVAMERKNRLRARRLAEASRKVRRESMRVDAEFSAIEQDPDA